jgi:hypothetical protein
MRALAVQSSEQTNLHVRRDIVRPGKWAGVDGTWGLAQARLRVFDRHPFPIPFVLTSAKFGAKEKKTKKNIRKKNSKKGKGTRERETLTSATCQGVRESAQGVERRPRLPRLS